jgi:hypothetical protein
LLILRACSSGAILLLPGVREQIEHWLFTAFRSGRSQHRTEPNGSLAPTGLAAMSQQQFGKIDMTFNTARFSLADRVVNERQGMRHLTASIDCSGST